MRRGFGFSGFGFNASNGLIAAAAAPVTDALGAALLALQTAGKLVSSWYLPQGNATQYLTLVGANVNLWSAAYGTQKVDLAVEVAAPQWDATLFSNKGGVTFDGTTQRLLGAGLVTNWPDSTSDLYMLAATRQDAAGATVGNKRALSYGGAADARGIGRTSVSSVNLGQAIPGTAFNGTVADFSGAHTVGMFCDISGTSALYLDGVSDATAATATPGLTLTRVRMGASNSNAASFFWTGVISCAAVLGPTASLSDFTALSALMQARVT